MSEVVTDSKGRAISVKELDPADMLDLMEAAGAQSINQGWMRMAMMVSSVTDIGGIPVPTPRTKEQIKTVARQLGNDGLVALDGHFFGESKVVAEADAVDAAKN